MRWEQLFADLAGQAAATETAQRDGWASERSRTELGGASLAERIRAVGGYPLVVNLVDGSRVEGTLLAVGNGWLSVAGSERGDEEVVVTDTALVRAQLVAPGGLGLTNSAGAVGAAVDHPLHTQLGLRPLLRRLGRQRVAVRLGLLGQVRTEGTVDAVGADHVQLAEHPHDEPRRRAALRSVSLVPLTSVLWLRFRVDPAGGSE